jgi:hypothetical protein
LQRLRSFRAEVQTTLRTEVEKGVLDDRISTGAMLREPNGGIK